MLFSLKGKSAVITGGGSGIGKAIALCFAGQGASVHILDINEAAAAETIRQIHSSGGLAEFVPCSVNQEEQVTSAIQSVIAKSRQIDILVNSAGIAHIGNLEKTQTADIDRLYEVNIKGTYHTMRSVIPHMKERHQGVILNLASVAATVGINDRFAYSMTKGAVVSMTLSVAKDYVKEGIRCNCVSPGRVHTPFVDGFLQANYPGKEEEMFKKLSLTQPIGRMARPEEIAWLALYLCSDEASFITGTDYPIDGGFIRLNN